MMPRPSLLWMVLCAALFVACFHEALSAIGAPIKSVTTNRHRLSSITSGSIQSIQQSDVKHVETFGYLSRRHRTLAAKERSQIASNSNNTSRDNNNDDDTHNITNIDKDYDYLAHHHEYVEQHPAQAREDKWIASVFAARAAKMQKNKMSTFSTNNDTKTSSSSSSSTHKKKLTPDNPIRYPIYSEFDPSDFKNIDDHAEGLPYTPSSGIKVSHTVVSPFAASTTALTSTGDKISSDDDTYEIDRLLLPGVAVLEEYIANLASRENDDNDNDKTTVSTLGLIDSYNTNDYSSNNHDNDTLLCGAEGRDDDNDIQTNDNNASIMACFAHGRETSPLARSSIRTTYSGIKSQKYHKTHTTMQATEDDTEEPAPNPVGTGQDTMELSMNTDTQAGQQNILNIRINNYQIAVTKSQYITIAFPYDSFSFNFSRCTWTANGSSLSKVTTSSYNDRITTQAERDIPMGSLIWVSCTNVAAATFEVKAGATIAMNISTIVNSNQRIFTSFTSATNIIPGPLGNGDIFPALTITPENKVLISIDIPYNIPVGDKFMIALDNVWYSSANPTCTMHTFADGAMVKNGGVVATATAEKVTSGASREMIIVTVNLSAKMTKGAKYALWCSGFAMPRSTFSVRTAASSIYSPTMGLVRARGDNVKLPDLRDEVGGFLFNVQLDSWTAGRVTTMTTTLMRFPIELLKGSKIRLHLPQQYTFLTDATSTTPSKCYLRQQQELDGSLIDIASTYSFDDDGGNILTFIINDQGKISASLGITQIACSSVLPLASHKALNNIKVEVFLGGEDTPIYSRSDGVMAEVYPANLGSVSREAYQSNTVAGGIGRVTVDVKPTNSGIRSGDMIRVMPDQDYRFSNITTCSLWVSNDVSNMMGSTGGDQNIPIGITYAVNTEQPWIVDLTITDGSEAKQKILERTDSWIRVECQGVKNPPTERFEKPTISMRLFNPKFTSSSQKASFSSAILPPISPASLGETARLYTFTSRKINTLGSMHIIVNTLTNPIPSSVNGGSIRFSLPAVWTTNAAGQTVCSCNYSNCDGTTSVETSIGRVINFRPRIEIVPGSTVIFTCTNIRSPTTAQGPRDDLKIESMKGADRIDVTETAFLPAIETNSFESQDPVGQVVHTLVWDRRTQFTSGEVDVLENAYETVFTDLQMTATILKQRVYTGFSFKLPEMYTDQDNSSIVNLDYNPNKQTTIIGDGGIPHITLARNMRHKQRISTLSTGGEDEIVENQLDSNDDNNIALNDESDTKGTDYTAAQTGARGYDDLYYFTEDSRVVVTAVLLQSYKIKKEAIISSLNLAQNKMGFSSRALETLSVQPIYRYTGLGDDMRPAHCRNGEHDQNETDIDCGGGSCDKCEGGFLCNENSDCKTGKCEKSGRCRGGNSASQSLNMTTLLFLTIMMIGAICAYSLMDTMKKAHQD